MLTSGGVRLRSDNGRGVDMQLKLKRIRPFVLPVGLIVLGICLLIGCIPIPATRQLQPNWRPRPETAVGPGPDKSIQPGRTNVADAFIAISTRIAPKTHGGESA